MPSVVYILRAAPSEDRECQGAWRVGREVGVLAPLGKKEKPWRSWWPVWDMRRVLMTHIGLVTTVLQAPAMMEDQRLMTNEVSARGAQRCVCQPPRSASKPNPPAEASAALGVVTHSDPVPACPGSATACTCCRR